MRIEHKTKIPILLKNVMIFVIMIDDRLQYLIKLYFISLQFKELIAEATI